MKTVRKAKPGDLVSAREYNAVVDVAAASGKLSVTGADAITGLSGPAIKVPSGPAIRVALQTTQWEFNKSEESPEYMPPEMWYADAKLFQRSPNNGRWGVDESEEATTIRVWAPLYTQDVGGDNPPPGVSSIRSRILVTRDPASGLWLLVSTPSTGPFRFTLKTRLNTGSWAEASLLMLNPSKGHDIIVYDAMGIFYGEPYSSGYAVWMPDVGRFEVIQLYC